MPARYDRATCANELLLRNTIAQRMQDGRGVAPPFHLPVTVESGVRIGRPEQPIGQDHGLGEDAKQTSQLTETGEGARDTEVVLTQCETLPVTQHVKTSGPQD